MNKEIAKELLEDIENIERIAKECNYPLNEELLNKLKSQIISKVRIMTWQVAMKTMLVFLAMV